MSDAGALATPCPRCRASRREGRLSLGYLARRLREDVFGLERGLLPTVWDLLRRPRDVVEAFLRGDEPRYYGPIKYFLVATAASLLLMPGLPLFDASLAGMLGKEVFTSPEAATRWVEDWNALLYTPLMVMLALSTRAFFRAAGLNLAEHLVMATYAWSQMLLISTAVLLLVVATKQLGMTGAWRVPLLLAPVAYWFWFCGQVLRIRRLADWLRCLVAVPTAWLAYLVMVLALASGVRLAIDAWG